MRLSIHESEVQGKVRTPSSKSYTIRGLMCAALARGLSEIRYPLSSDDSQAAMSVLEKIGVKISLQEDLCLVEGDHFREPREELFCGDSAATLRFMSAICALVPGTSRLTAGSSLSKRPMKSLVEALQMWEINISSSVEGVTSIMKGGKFSGGHTELPGDISSQYVSALLLAAPLAEKDTRIRLTTPLESRPYVLMTLECLKQFGIEISYSDELMEYKISPQQYRPSQYIVEGDWSSASYLLSLGAIGGEITVENLNPLSLQGDKALVDILRQMGARIKVKGDSVTVSRDRLKAVKADLTDCIDLLPTVAVLAALAEGASEFTGIRRARLKESDRISSVREGLERTGIRVLEAPDTLIIRGGKPQTAVVDAKNDHRIAMSFSLMGVAQGGIVLEGAECVSKTYPEYWQTLRGLGVKIDEQ